MKNATTHKLQALGLRMTCEYGAEPNETIPESDPWTCRLTYTDTNNKRRRMTVPFYMGFGHGGREPELADVVSALIMDASTIEYASSFENFAAELGYDSDSRTAERLYKACKRTHQRLHKFLADDFGMIAAVVEDY
jgi:hypothetical protein